MTKVNDLKLGTFMVIRVDGTESLIEEQPTIRKVYVAIGCDVIDTVILVRNGNGETADIVMMVDDCGMIDGKPVNPKATELYHSVCRPGAGSIHGDVAIVRDEDFA